MWGEESRHHPPRPLCGNGDGEQLLDLGKCIELDFKTEECRAMKAVGRGLLMPILQFRKGLKHMYLSQSLVQKLL